MKTSARGRTDPRAGVTLLEMVTVAAVIGILAAVAFPSVSAGLDSVRLASAADSLAAFLNGAFNRAERRQQAVEIAISPRENRLLARSAGGDFRRVLELPDGVRIEAVLPASPEPAEEVRRIVAAPGGTLPRVAVQLLNQRGARRLVRVDPLTGVPRIETPAAEP